MINEICSKEECTGCGLCENICPKGAVSIKIIDGFYTPSITEDCVDCGLCQASCIANSNVVKNKTPDVSYAAWCKNDTIHYESSSGGLAYKLAFDFVAGGGAVAGVWLNPESRTVEHRIYHNTDELEQMRGSRYVQSKKGKIYEDVRRELKDRDVLFIGVPCEVYAVKQYLKKNVLKENHQLFCVDILCHGGASPQCLNEHVNAIVHSKQISNILFRGGRDDCRFTIWDKNGKRLFMCGQYYDAYFMSFMKRSIFRTSCYSCSFAGLERVGDLTLGDFWGIDKTVEKQTAIRGINLILVNNDDGKALLDRLEPDSMVRIERPIQEAVNGNDTLREATQKPEEYEELWKYIRKYGFHKAYKKVYGIGWKMSTVMCYMEMVKYKIVHMLKK